MSDKQATDKQEKNKRATSEPERSIARDIVRRGLLVAPFWILATGLIWGVGGAASSAYGLALVLANLLAAAAIITHAARISPNVLMAAVMGGFIVRIVLLAAAVFAVSWHSLFEAVPLAITILVSHLGLLTWETRYVSLALAQPGLVPRTNLRSGKRSRISSNTNHMNHMNQETK